MPLETTPGHEAEFLIIKGIHAKVLKVLSEADGPILVDRSQDKNEKSLALGAHDGTCTGDTIHFSIPSPTRFGVDMC